jgi:hypothetical protein
MPLWLDGARSEARRHVKISACCVLKNALFLQVKVLPG